MSVDSLTVTAEKSSPVVILRILKPLLARIAAYGEGRFPTRAETIRVLLDRALETNRPSGA